MIESERDGIDTLFLAPTPTGVTIRYIHGAKKGTSIAVLFHSYYWSSNSFRKYEIYSTLQ